MSDSSIYGGPLYCSTCGYNLDGLPESRCPECGTEFSLDLVREENRQLRVNPRLVLLQYALVPGIAIAFVVATTLWFAAGHGDAIPLVLVSAGGGMICSLAAALITARKLGRYSVTTASKGIGGTPSRFRVFILWLLLSAAACVVLWYGTEFIFSTIPTPVGP